MRESRRAMLITVLSGNLVDDEPRAYPMRSEATRELARIVGTRRGRRNGYFVAFMDRSRFGSEDRCAMVIHALAAFVRRECDRVRIDDLMVGDQVALLKEYEVRPPSLAMRRRPTGIDGNTGLRLLEQRRR